MKYKNLRASYKKTQSENSKQMKMTGGGRAKLDLTNEFDFVEEQVLGLVNKFDSDAPSLQDNSHVEDDKVDEIVYMIEEVFSI